MFWFFRKFSSANKIRKEILHCCFMENKLFLSNCWLVWKIGICQSGKSINFWFQNEKKMEYRKRREKSIEKQANCNSASAVPSSPSVVCSIIIWIDISQHYCVYYVKLSFIFGYKFTLMHDFSRADSLNLLWIWRKLAELIKIFVNLILPIVDSTTISK